MSQTVKLLRPADLAHLLGVGISTLHRMRAEGRIPKPEYIGKRQPRWRSTTIDAWILAGRPMLATPKQD